MEELMRDSERVVFVSMPFASSRRPSLGLSLLQAQLQEAGIPSLVWYPFLPFVSQVGTTFYEGIADGKYPSNYLMGEWIFTPWLMDDLQDGRCDSEEDIAYLHYLQQVPSWLDVSYGKGISPEDIARVTQVRQQIPAFFENALKEFDWQAIRFVGFTSVFQQHVASLAFARILKKHYPHLTIVFGGANVEGPMGQAALRSFPWVDAIVSGEGDNVIVPLVEAVLAGQDYAQVSGVWTRRSLKLTYPPRVRMDDLPYPIFDDFFDQYSRYNVKDEEIIAPSLMVETSRGCWWGEHSHCTFCGLNGLSMAYRSKSSQRAVEEITSLWDRYSDRAADVLAVDNILDYKHINTMLPQLAQHTKRFSLFYETKANLKKQQIETMAKASIDRVQPGIESLSTHVLKVMRKGISALNNVQVLKWCLEYRIVPYWNILWGFPGERPDDYVQSNEWASRLFHLQPPVSTAPIRLDRFSPLFDTPDEFGVKDIKPAQAYDYVFSQLPQQERFELAYFFKFDYRERPGSGYTTDLTQTIIRWNRTHHTAALFYFPADTNSLLVDTRAEPQLWLLDQSYTALLDAIDAIAITGDLVERLEIEPSLLTIMLSTLEEHQWILQEENKVLGLAIRLGKYQPSAGAQQMLSTLFDAQSGQAMLAGRITVPVAVS
jgi:ribosomal peptide maturation radical SAM protein 1